MTESCHNYVTYGTSCAAVGKFLTKIFCMRTIWAPRVIVLHLDCRLENEAVHLTRRQQKSYGRWCGHMGELLRGRHFCIGSRPSGAEEKSSFKETHNSSSKEALIALASRHLPSSLLLRHHHSSDAEQQQLTSLLLWVQRI